MKKIFSLSAFILTLALSTSTVCASANVKVEKVKIGGSSASLVQIEMIDGRTADIALASSQLHTDTSASEIVKEPANDNNSTIVAGINGGFFNSYYTGNISYPNNYPIVYATVVKDGKVLNGGGEANYIGITWDGKAYIDRATINAKIYTGSQTITPWVVGVYSDDTRAISLLTDEFPYTVSLQEGAKAFVIRDDKITSVAENGNYSVPTGTSLLIYNKEAIVEAEKWNILPKISDQAVISLTGSSTKKADDNVAWDNMKTVMSGGRMILQNTYDVTEDSYYNSDFDSDSKQSATSVAQRSFVATTVDGNLILGTANTSFKQIATYLKSIGAVNAVSLDGGASSMLYEKSSGFITPAGRKLAVALIVVDEATVEFKNSNTDIIKDTTQSNQQAISNANSPSAWAVETINNASNIGLVPEWLQYNYRSNITRREFCVLIVEMIQVKTGKTIDEFRAENGAEYKSMFIDVDDFYINECASLGIVNGSDGMFRPTDSISRQEAASILKRTAELLDIKATDKNNVFADQSSISNWAKEAVAFVTSIGVMNGDGEKFNPSGMFTREQAYITMYNMFRK